MLKEFSSFLRAERGALALTALHLAVLAALTRGLTIDYWDGIISRLNGLAVWGAAPPGMALDVTRAVLGWLLASPLVAGAYAAAGPAGGFAAGRVAALLTVAASLLAAYAWYRRLFPRPAALLLLAVLALNPVLLQYAPSAVFDSLGFLGVAAFCAAAAGRSVGWLFAAYAAAVATRLHLATLVLSLALLALTPAARGRRRFFVALIALCIPAYLSLFTVSAALVAWSQGVGPVEALRSCHEAFTGYAFYNAALQEPRQDWLYLRSLWSQLGPLGSLLCLAGLWSWLRSPKLEESIWACAALASLAFLQLAMKNQEQRYLLAYLPIFLAAAGRGVELAAAGRPRPALASVVAAALAFLPWGGTWRSLRYLAEEPSLRSTEHVRAGSELSAAVSAGGCAHWKAGDRFLMPSRVQPPTDEQQLIVGAPLLAFYSGRGVGDCASSVSVIGGPKGELEVLASRN